MKNNPLNKTFFEDLISSWTAMMLRHRLGVLALFVLSTAMLFWYIIGHLGIITSTTGMISPDLEYLKLYHQYKKAFPQSSDTIVIVIDGENPDIAIDARNRLAAELLKEREHFKEIYAPGSEDFFKKNGLLYLSVHELEALSQRLAEIQPLLGTLAREPDLRGLFSILGQAEGHGEEKRLDRLYAEIEKGVRAVEQDRFYQVSWLNLMDSGGASLTRANRRQFVIAYPVLDYTTILPGKEAMQQIRDAINRLKLDQAHGLRARLTGDIAMEYEELASVTRGAKLAGWLSLFMVAVVLFAGLRSGRLVFVTLLTLLTGLVWTAGFAAAAIGHLNMISVAFAVLFIGLGVDYSIHYCLRFRELLRKNNSPASAIEKTARDTGMSLVLCAVTTATGFFAFVPTDFSGVGELGLISGTGMFIGLFINLTLLPVLLSLLGFKPSEIHEGDITAASAKSASSGSGLSLFMKFVTFPVRHSRAVRITALVLGLLSLTLLPRITYDWNPLNLRDQTCESVSTFKELLADVNCTPWSLDVLKKPYRGLPEEKDRLGSLPVVDKVVDIADFVPDNQEDKLSIIEELDYVIGPVFMQPQAAASTCEDKIAAIKNFISAVRIKAKDASGRPTPSEQLASLLEQFLEKAEKSENPEGAIKRLEKSLVGSLPPRLEELKMSLQAEPFSLDSLPNEVKERWIATDGRWRLEIFPRESLNSPERLINFITSVRQYEPEATGYPVIIYEGGKVVSNAFKEAFSMSLVVITCLLLFLMPRKKDAVLVLLPLALAAALTGAIMEVAGITLNFANIIALPLILGIGVDNGIHMVHRFRTMKADTSEIFSTSTSRGIFFSTLTTICSFGNLAVSPHEGMASMGKLLALGVGLTLVCTMVLLPALMAWEQNRASNSNLSLQGRGAL